MQNPILGAINQSNLMSKIGNVQPLINMMRSANNPQALISQLINNDPRMAEVNKLIEQSGGDPEKAFRAKAQELGVNPEDVMRLFK